MSQHKLLVLADLHVDHWAHHNDKALGKTLRDPDNFCEGYHEPDLIVHAGDLCDGRPLGWGKAIPAVMRNFRKNTPSVFFPGNHDYFHGTLKDGQMKADCERVGVKFGQKTVTHLGATRILTCTLWTDAMLSGSEDHEAVKLAMSRGMPEFRMVRTPNGGNKNITPEDTIAIHHEHVAWLKAELSRGHDGPTVVITHHCPHLKAAGKESSLLGGFVSDLSAMIEEHQPEAWIFGHTHYPVSGTQGKTRIHNVGLGYPRPYTVANAAWLLQRGCVEVGDEVRFVADAVWKQAIRRWSVTKAKEEASPHP